MNSISTVLGRKRHRPGSRAALGEPGIGKRFVGAFAEQLAAEQIRIAQGQCLDHHGGGEPYLPLIEALTRFACRPDGAAVKEVLAAHAPSWLAQMPSLWTRSERRAAGGARASRERMLRELTLAVEAITAEAPPIGNAAVAPRGHVPSWPTSADLRGAKSRQLSEVLETCRSNGRHSRF